MNPDPQDLMAQCREAMTEWERNLRPKPERHRLLWLVLAVLLACLAWRGTEWLRAPHPNAGRPAGTSSAMRAPTEPPPVDARIAPEPRSQPHPRAESYGVTKCMSATGQATYSDVPCPAQSQASTVWVQPDVNLADGLSDAAREASMRNNRAIAAQVQQHERLVAQNTGTGTGSNDCAALDAHIKWIDAMARQPQGASTQDDLTQKRKGARDRQFRLRC